VPQTLVPTDLTASSVNAVAEVLGTLRDGDAAHDPLPRPHARHDVGVWSRSWAPTRRSPASKTHRPPKTPAQGHRCVRAGGTTMCRRSAVTNAFDGRPFSIRMRRT